jgi:hypothetical protein
LPRSRPRDRCRSDSPRPLFFPFLHSFTTTPPTRPFRGSPGFFPRSARAWDACELWAVGVARITGGGHRASIRAVCTSPGLIVGSSSWDSRERGWHGIVGARDRPPSPWRCVSASSAGALAAGSWDPASGLAVHASFRRPPPLRPGAAFHLPREDERTSSWGARDRWNHESVVGASCIGAPAAARRFIFLCAGPWASWAARERGKHETHASVRWWEARRSWQARRS